MYVHQHICMYTNIYYLIYVCTPTYILECNPGCSQKSILKVSKETYYSVKRDILQCQKRPITVSKETYYRVKRDLLQCQKSILKRQ